MGNPWIDYFDPCDEFLFRSKHPASRTVSPSELHPKHFQIGMLSSVFFLGAFFLSIAMGWLVDRVGVYWTMAISQLVVGSFILSISLAHSFSTVCGFLFLAGMGDAPINPATGKVVMSWFPIKGRATAMGVKQMGIPMGGVLGAATLPTVAMSLNRRKTFMISGVTSLLSVLFYLFFSGFFAIGWNEATDGRLRKRRGEKFFQKYKIDS